MEKETVPPGRVKTKGAKPSGSRDRISFKGKAMASPVRAGGGAGAGAGSGAMPGDTRVMAGETRVTPGETGAGAATAAGSSLGGVARGGRAHLENSDLIAPNMVVLAAILPEGGAFRR
jgi:hypothetical protein